MTDRLSASARSKNMSLIKNKHTKPEMVVRKIVFSLGFRYRLHDRNLPGTPDLIFPRKRKLIFVNGCFWHMHENCVKFKLPASNREFWTLKLQGNRYRDDANLQKLTDLGWRVLIVWECELRDKDELREKLVSFLDD